MNHRSWTRTALAASLSMLALLVGVGAFGLLPERAQAEPAQDGVPRLHYVIFVDDDNWQYCEVLAGAAEQWKTEEQFQNVKFMSVHHSDQRDEPLWELAYFAHFDNPMAGLPPTFFGTPFGILDGGYDFFRGFEEGEAAKQQFRARIMKVQERATAGAEMLASYQVGEDGNVLLAVTIYSEMDITLGAANNATLSAAMLVNERHPYFSISAYHQANGALCSELEPGGAVSCGIPMGRIEPEVLANSEMFVTLTYQPDPEKASHDSVQAAIAVDANAPEPVDEPPTVAQGIADVVVEMGEAAHQIDLGGVFTDPDDDDAAIVKSILSNSNTGLVSTSIEGDTLTLGFTPEMSGSAIITVQANSDGQTVDDSFTVTVRDSSAPTFVIHLPVGSKGHSFR